MNFTYIQRLLIAFALILLMGFSKRSQSQNISSCAKIESILVAACGQPEGQNEMLRFQIGNTPENTSNLSIQWATTSIPWSGLIQNTNTANKVDSINAQITGCGWVLEPTAGVLPAGAQVIIVTSYDMITSYNLFTNLQDTIYMIFHNSTTTTGHFKNYGCPGCYRTTILTFSGSAGCSDTATYEPDSLRTTSGVYGPGGGGSVNFNYNGTKTYFNDGCQAPFIMPKISAGNDTTYTFCTSVPIILLTGKIQGNFKHFHWYGGHGIFSHPDSLSTTYTLSPLDVSPIQFRLTGSFSCHDSLAATVNITIIPPIVHSSNANVCNGGSYHVGIHNYTTSGSYIDTLISSQGCDSIIHTNLNITTPIIIAVPLSGCNQVIYNGTTYTSSTTIKDTLRSRAGCDSVYNNITISINGSVNVNQSVNLCPGHSVHVGTHTYSTAGIFRDTMIISSGCDSIVTTTVTLNTPLSLTFPFSGCGQVSYGGFTFTSSTVIHDTLRSTLGCDSLYLTANITVNQPSSFTQNKHLCQGQTITIGTHIHGLSGTYIDTINNTAGCDSIITTNLTIDTAVNQTSDQIGCNQVTYNGNTYNTNTVLSQTIQNVHGCDSIVKTVNIIVTHPVVFTQNPVLCQGQVLFVGIKSYGSSGLYIDTLRNAALGGCDSIIHTNLTVIAPYTGTLQLSDTCAGTYKGQTYTSSAVIQDTLRSQSTGCDSVYLTVTINIVTPNIITNNKNVSICLGQSYLAGGQLQTTAGVYRDTIQNSIGGCDSLITITNLSVIAPQYISQRYDTCNPITIGNVVYSSDTIVTDTTYSALGCISLIQTDTIHIKAANITVLSTALLPIKQGDSTQLIINPTGNYQNIIWSPNEWITNRYLAAPIVVPNITTAYMVTAEDANHCQVSAQIIVTVSPSDEPDFVMPSAFSPNGDGKNDTYGPIMNPNAQLATYHIYNRWGELVFDKDQSGTNQWDGTYKGAQQPGGVYMYFITVVSSQGKTTNKEGNFTLLH